MTTQEFTAVLDRPVATDEDHDRLFEAGLDDTSPEGSLLHVHRRSESVAEAILSVVIDANKAGFTVVGLLNQDLVTLEQIATRTGRTYESVRKLRSGQRGPGGFPQPQSVGSFTLYSWSQVADWFRARLRVDLSANDAADQVLAAADHLLRARMLVDPDTLAQLTPLTAT
jgi:hypothetical protein